MNNQKPCADTLVTCTGEVLGPGAADLIKMLLDQFLSLSDLRWLEAVVDRQFHHWLDPELGFAGRVLDVNMRTLFLARKKVEPKPSNPQNGRTHCAQNNLTTRVPSPASGSDS